MVAPQGFWYRDVMRRLTALLVVAGLVGIAPAVRAGADIDLQPESEWEPEVAPAPKRPPRRLSFEEERHRRNQAGKNNFLGGVFEGAAALLFLGTYAMTVGADLRMPPEGCDAPSKPCYIGSPVVVLVPIGATTMGIVAASRFAAARDANMWHSPLFLAGMVVGLGAYGAAIEGDQASRSKRIAWHTTFLSLAVVGAVMQAWGALTATPREEEPAVYSVGLVPGCGPTQGHGLVCGVTGTTF
jgi:hypothetical protein